MATRKPHQPPLTVKRKKKTEVAVLDITRKKRRKKSGSSTELALPNRISKLKGNQTSIIGDSVNIIQEMLESDNNESATTLIQKRLMQTLVDVLPYAEDNIRESKGQKGIYAFNSLITSLRELMIDIQSTRDKGAIGDALVEKIVRPTFLDIGMNLVLEDERMLKDIKEEVDVTTYRKIREIHQASLGRTAKLIQEKYAEAKQQAIAFLQQ
jgi:hypothetical protein